MSGDLDLVKAMLPYARTSTLPTLRRSQYLADALQQLNATGAERSKTPLALAGNLGAVAINQFAANRNFDDLTKDLQGDQASYMQGVTGGLPGAAQPSAAPSSAPGANPAPVQQQQLPPAGAPQQQSQSPQMGGGIPTQPILPQEMAELQRLGGLAQTDPRFMQPYMEMAQKLKERSLSPIDPSKPQFVSDGNGGFTVKDLGKSVTSQPGPFPGSSIETTNATGAKSLFNPMGGAISPGSNLDPVTGAEVKRPSVIGDRIMPFGPLSPEQVAALPDRVLGTEQYKMADESMKAYSAMVANATQPGGMSAYAMRDTFARAINPGAVARSGTLQAIAEARGIPDSVKGFLLNLKGDGDLDQNTKQQILHATLPFVQANYEALARVAKDYEKNKQVLGLKPTDAPVDIGSPPQPFNLPPEGSRPALGGDLGVSRPNAPNGIARPQSPADLAKLPKGALYQAPDGSTWRKK